MAQMSAESLTPTPAIGGAGHQKGQGAPQEEGKARQEARQEGQEAEGSGNSGTVAVQAGPPEGAGVGEAEGRSRAEAQEGGTQACRGATRTGLLWKRPLLPTGQGASLGIASPCIQYNCLLPHRQMQVSMMMRWQMG